VSRKGDPSDRRKVLIQLTHEAEQMAMEIYGQMAHATAPYIDQLSDGDLLTLISFFEVSRRVNLELAESVRTRTDRRKIPLRQRLEQVKELKEHAKALTKTLKREAKDWVKVDFLVGGSRWVQDDNGRWVEKES
jgi:DNA-binding MarR family transcriptional regulator